MASEDDDVVDAEFSELVAAGTQEIDVPSVFLCPGCGIQLDRDAVVIDARRSARRIGLCVDCHERWLVTTPVDIFAALGQALATARRAHLPATLTRKQWKAVVVHFEARCAYCDGPWAIIDHATPITLGGGTTASNCVPACIPCNVRKGRRRLEDWKEHDGRALTWLRTKGR